MKIFKFEFSEARWLSVPGRAETLLGRAVCALERSWNVPRALWDVAVARARGKVEVNFLGR